LEFKHIYIDAYILALHALNVKIVDTNICWRTHVKEDILKRSSTTWGWDVKRKVPPKAHGPPIEAFILDDNSPIPCVEDYLIDAECPVEAYL
jgi:hypothetical protein